MKRRSLIRVMRLSTSVLLLLFLGCSFAQAQRRSRSSKPAGQKIIAAEWRYPELVGNKGLDNPVDVGDHFLADHLDGDTVTVYIPGAYGDNLETGSHTTHSLAFQLAAAVFVRVMAAPTKDATEAMEKYFLGWRDRNHGSCDPLPEYSFRLSDGRMASIFVYFNNDKGLIGVVRTGPLSRKNLEPNEK